MPNSNSAIRHSQAAYASHGDTKTRFAFPSSPKSVLEMTADAFDLTEKIANACHRDDRPRFGMNDHIANR